MEIRYDYLIAIIILVLLVWVGIIFYRVGREGVIKKIDFWRAKWKIVLFWMIIAAIVFLGLYLMNKYNLWPEVSSQESN